MLRPRYTTDLPVLVLPVPVLDTRKVLPKDEVKEKYEVCIVSVAAFVVITRHILLVLCSPAERKDRCSHHQASLH